MQQLKQQLNILTYEPYNTNHNEKYFSLIAGDFQRFPMDVAGYSRVIFLENIPYTLSREDTPLERATFDIHTSTIHILKDEKILESIDISEKIDYLYKLHKKHL